MRTINAISADDAYRQGMELLMREGVRRPSRYGDVIVLGENVTTHYSHPHRRVVYDAQRDANPFFHLFESLWMLNGDNDVEFLEYYLPRMKEFSDNGQVFHGAYGFRWRRWYPDFPTEPDRSDQLESIIRILRADRYDRRAILQMWDPMRDLERKGKDFPCNVTAKFEIGVNEQLNMTVFNRSNDIIWGCYGANVVHFSFLQEYIAQMVGVPVGWYEQVTTNFHAYSSVLDKYYPFTYPHAPTGSIFAKTLPLVDDPPSFDAELREVVYTIRAYRTMGTDLRASLKNIFFDRVVAPLVNAYFFHKNGRSDTALRILCEADAQDNDWIQAGKLWIMRRVERRRTEGDPR